MKTSDELWRWIWQDDEVIDGRALADLLEDVTPVPPPPPPSIPAPAIRTEDIWEWLSRDDPLLDPEMLGEGTGWSVPSGPDAPEVVEAPPGVETPAVPEAQEPEREVGEVTRARRPRPRRGFTGRSTWIMAVALVAAVAGIVAPQVLPAMLRPAPTPGPRVAVVPEQHVVAWSIADDSTGLAFVAVLGAGVHPPVVVAIPSEVTINLPGQGLGSMRDAAVTGDRALIKVATENLLGAPVDASVIMTVDELAAAIDGAGGITVADQPTSGAAAVQYLTAPEAAELPDERFLRWEDVLDALVHTVAVRPEAAQAFPEELRTVLAASSPEPADLLALPVTDIGGGVLRPDVVALEELVTERFDVLGADEVRLVVLNGVGEPGIGEEVARILIPNGFRLVSSENANRFDLRVTRIIASTEEDLPAARRARDLLGAGQILLGAQPQLTDVTIVVGSDFAGGR